MKNLYAHYSNLTAIADNWLYYVNVRNLFTLDTIFTKNYSKRFIESYFFEGGKSKAFEWIKEEKLFEIPAERANHTMSAFLMGIMLRDSLHMDMKKLPKIDNSIKRNFLYFWSLTCLYHDIAFNLETNSSSFIKSCRNIHEFIYRFRIKYNLLHALKHTNTSSLIENYYLYRADHGYIEHGIAGAMLFYDGLMKAYYAAKEERDIKKNESFDYKGLRFSRDFPKRISYIAEIIAKHNLWRAKPNEEEEYLKYNLNVLIPNAYNDHILSYGEEHNLLFLLGLIDTIEPLKCYRRYGITDPYDIIKNLLHDVNYNKFEITFKSNKSEFNAYMNDVKKLQDWMDVKIYDDIETIKIIINKEKTQEEEEIA